jgi:ABC-type multidrug transport system permease subunit
METQPTEEGSIMHSWWNNLNWRNVSVALIVLVFLLFCMAWLIKLGFLKWLIGLFVFLFISYILLVNMNEPDEVVDSGKERT